MRYNVKVVRNNMGIEDGETQPCDYMQVKTVPPGCYAATHDINDDLCSKSGKPPLAEPGVTVSLFPSNIIFNLPADGDAIYVTNAEGKTVDSHHWPLRPKKYGSVPANVASLSRRQAV